MIQYYFFAIIVLELLAIIFLLEQNQISKQYIEHLEEQLKAKK